ncbi:Protein containing acetyltransferase (GNAT family) domain protein [Enhygromyxa salina]|uniref:Protein containing acetyltransferase (GNAT family) domain protein n=1 Tax=Enhygromyxa salina TaxID=215803 RepID=A0A0C2D8Z8_9BACT|nr:GNAT family N-acetyltransferase [Enhygromyxa salina]KIG18085.1 Protein containing acetyltransferase (GNAT family) domain protein [Enhygromyxa salina]
MNTRAQANIGNLTNLWRLMGAEQRTLGTGTTLHVSKAWPHRRWLDWDKALTEADVPSLRAALRDDRPVVMPVWPGAHPELLRGLGGAGLEPGFTQLGMYRPRTLALGDKRSGEVGSELGRLALIDVETESSIHAWTRTASLSFGYAIDVPVIAGIVGSPGVQLLIATLGDEPVGTSMLFEDTHAVGVHMVGVLPTHRRRGLAREIMFETLRRARDAAAANVVLQASQLGEPLYRSLGFEAQFVLTNYMTPRADARASASASASA